MIFYYLGGEVNALYREGAVAYHGQARPRAPARPGRGRRGRRSRSTSCPSTWPTCCAGITNRQKLKETLHSKADLVELLRRMEKSEHTGTLEVQTADGVGMSCSCAAASRTSTGRRRAA